jgi:hypothetical protein
VVPIAASVAASILLAATFNPKSGAVYFLVGALAAYGTKRAMERDAR